MLFVASSDNSLAKFEGKVLRADIPALAVNVPNPPITRGTASCINSTTIYSPKNAEG